MNILKLILITLVFFLPSFVHAEGVSVPRAFEYDGLQYKHDSFLKDYAITFRADIEGNGREDTIVMFPASDEKNFPRAFTFIYGDGYEFRIPTYEYPQKIEAIDIDHDGQKEVFLYAHGGVHYTKLFVLKYEKGKGLHKIFENGSALGVEFGWDNKRPTIKVGRDSRPDEGWSLAHPEPRWEVYQWDGQEFQYQPRSSTAKQTPEPREYQGLVGEYTAASGQNVLKGSAVRARKGDTLVYRKETITADDHGPEQMFSHDAGGTFRVRRESHQEFIPVRKEDFGEAFGFYLKQGLSWETGQGGLTERCSRKPDHPCYYVQKVEDVITSAGVFKGCFKIVVDNIPDFDARWYYPGIGVVRSEYKRHGPILISTSELEEIRRQ